jgi:hypothetical protein
MRDVREGDRECVCACVCVCVCMRERENLFFGESVRHILFISEDEKYHIICFFFHYAM